MIQAQRRLLGLKAVGDQTSHQMHHEVDGAAMAGVLDPGNILELINHACATAASPGFSCWL